MKPKGFWSTGRPTTPEQYDAARPLLETAMEDGQPSVEVGGVTWTYTPVPPPDEEQLWSMRVTLSLMPLEGYEVDDGDAYFTAHAHVAVAFPDGKTAQLLAETAYGDIVKEAVERRGRAMAYATRLDTVSG